MSVIKITSSDYETFTLITTPHRSYVSSSFGVTGSIKVFPRQSDIEKNTSQSFYFNDNAATALVDINFDSAAKKIAGEARTKRAQKLSIEDKATSYLSLVSKSSVAPTSVLDVERFTPTTKFTKYTICKNNIKDMLMPRYLTEYPHAQWAYTNYHSLNFFTSMQGTKQLVPTASVLLYPNLFNPLDEPDVPLQEGYCNGLYNISGAFSFDFYINPRYKTDGLDAGHFKAGTIFHLSSSYAVSLVSGTLKDENGLPEGFRIQLQLSHSADYAPSKFIPGSYPHDLIFLSDDNSLRYNKWHHVVVRWGSKYINDGTGSFVIDGVNRGNFVVTSGTINPRSFDATTGPSVLCVGNYYEGTNQGMSAQTIFFAPNPAKRDGLEQLTTYAAEEPAHYAFRHPLKAEVHDLTIRRYFMSDAESSTTGSRGPGTDAFVRKNIAFYLPPFFIEDVPLRRYVGDHGGVLQTPFFEVDGTTDDPFNVAMAFGVNGHYINLENFAKDFTNKRFPRLLNLTGTAIDHTTDALEANYFLYQDGGVAKRNLTILPCDDGAFDPNYDILKSENTQNKYADQYGTVDYSYINLDKLLSTASLLAGGISQYSSDSETYENFQRQLQGFTPEQPGLPPGDAALAYYNKINNIVTDIPAGQDASFDRGVQRGVPLTIYNRLQDASSNQITIFNISNLYYGRRIQPGSFEIKDTSLSGSHGAVKITLRDDSLGNIYRADALTTHATQNSVGNIFYDEGIVVIKNPHLYFFGKEQYEMSFRGVYNIYSTKYEVLAGPGLFNSSSNATYSANYGKIKASSSPVDNEDFVYISGMNFHDENMNVVAKAKLAQPIIKREGDKVLFKVAFDF